MEPDERPTPENQPSAPLRDFREPTSEPQEPPADNEEATEAESEEAPAPDADGPSAPAEASTSELIQHPNGSFEVVVQQPIRNEE